MTSPITPVSHAGILQLGAERRKAERTALSIQAILRFQDRLQILQGTVCDLSVGGSGFICHQAVTAQSKCTLQFMLPMLAQMASQSANLPVVVVNSMQVIGQVHQFRVNLRFNNLPPAIRHHIEALIRQSLSRS